MLEEPVLPTGWVERFMERADLEASYRELEGYNHFHAETLRGRIRSLEFRFEESWSRFERARRDAMRSRETLKNLLRRFLLEQYAFESYLVHRGHLLRDADAILLKLARSAETSRTSSEGEDPTEPFVLPEVPDLPLRREIEAAIRHRRVCEGLFRLHIGQHETARAIFEALLADPVENQAAQRTSYLLGLAASEWNLGLAGLALRDIENAEWSTRLIEGALPAAMACAALVGIHRYLGNEAEARNWELYLEHRIDCPPRTRSLFLRRARLLTERCYGLERLVVF